MQKFGWLAVVGSILLITAFFWFNRAQPPATQVIYVAAQPASCVGVAPQRCLQIKTAENGVYQLYYGQIAGFTYEPGYEYQLEVVPETIADPAADQSSKTYQLVQQLSKQPQSFIVINQPTPGASVTSPVTVTGQVRGAFEGNVVVTLVDATEQEIGQTITTVPFDPATAVDWQVQVQSTATNAGSMVISARSPSPVEGEAGLSDWVPAQLTLTETSN